MATDVIMLFVLLFACMALGIPIGISVGIATVVTMVTSTNINVLTIAQNCIGGLDSFPLMAIPFFILSGNLMRLGGLSEKLVNLAKALVGGLKGGLGMVTVMSCLFFSAISGSAPATVSAIGSTMIPRMSDNGYDKGYAGALTATAGSLGVILPPSIPFVIYGVVSGTSIGGLFLAGVFPGFILAAALLITNYIMSRRNNYGAATDGIIMKEVLVALKAAIPAMLVPVIILGGIYGGVFTPTEAAVVSVFYALFVGKFIYRELALVNIYEALRDTAQITGATVFIIGLSLSFAGYMTMARVPVTVGNAISSLTENPILIMLMLNAFLILMGLCIDNISNTIILTPILLPIAVSTGMDPIHFGVMMTLNLAIGFVTPPYGVNVMFASAIGKVPMEKIIAKSGALLIAMFIVLMIITYIPVITMYLPTALM